VSAISTVGEFIERIAEAGRARLRPMAPDAGLADRCAELLSQSGEASGIALARDILGRYAMLDGEGRKKFFASIAERFGVDGGALAAAIAAHAGAPEDATARALHRASEPRSQNLIRRLNQAPNGTRDLVGMRGDLIEALAEAPGLRGLDEDFTHLFGSWFNRGFLELRTIDWNTPASILEKIIRYEAVHEIRGWDDLRRRVAAPDRKLYAFFHPAMRDDPLIFVEVALTDATPDAIGPILAGDREPLDVATATTAVFYSISNCQPGLRGVSFGAFLIKQVVEELRRDCERLRTFVTLSPVPGLRAWAEAEILADAPLTGPAQREGVRAGEPDACTGAAALYLLNARDSKGRPLDPVARFHLGNGARLERINPGADASARGMAQSWGVMVNYLYDPREIEKNHEAFANEGAISASAAVRRMARAH
jgi:malonyl-CoA decarboxylase